MHLLLGVDGSRFSNDVGHGDAVGQEIVPADAAFGEAGVAIRAAAKRDDERCDPLAIELHGVVEPRVKDGRGPATVLRRAEDGDGIGGNGLIHRGDLVDSAVNVDAPEQCDEQDDSDEAREDRGAAGRAAGLA